MGKRAATHRAAIKRADIRKTYKPDSQLVSRINDALAGRACAPQALARGSSGASEVASSSSCLSARDPAVADQSSIRAVRQLNTLERSAPNQKRSDAPVIHTPGRASIQDAFATTQDDDSRNRALQTLELDKAARSARASNASIWRTWQRMHQEWFKHSTPVLPLTPHKIGCVAAMFKAGHYASFSNYVSRAKAMHVRAVEEHKVPWSEELSMAVRMPRAQ